MLFCVFQGEAITNAKKRRLDKQVNVFNRLNALWSLITYFLRVEISLNPFILVLLRFRLSLCLRRG